MAYVHHGDTKVFIIKDKNGNNYIKLNELIQWMKDQQKLEPDNGLLHFMIRSVIKINNDLK